MTSITEKPIHPVEKQKKSSLRLNLIKKFRATPAILTKRCTEHDFSFFKNFNDWLAGKSHTQHEIS